MPDPFTIGAPIAARAVLPLARMLGKKLKGDEPKAIERSFREAIRNERRERGEDAFNRPGLLGRALEGSGKLWNAGKRRVIPEGKAERRAEENLARWLAWTWREASLEEAASQAVSSPEAAEAGRRDQAPSGWFVALVRFLEEAAKESTAESPPQNADREEAWAWSERRNAWQRALDISTPLDDEGARTWATRVASRIETIWRQNQITRTLIVQLNHDSREGLIEAIAFSSQDVARSLRRLVSRTIPVALLGAGGVALAVLFIDKG